MFIFHRVGGIHWMGLFILFLYVKSAWIRKKKRQPPADGGFSSHTDFLVANEAFIKISWSRSKSPQKSYIPKWDVLPSRILPWNSKIRNHDLTATIHPSQRSFASRHEVRKDPPRSFRWNQDLIRSHRNILANLRAIPGFGSEGNVRLKFSVSTWMTQNNFSKSYIIMV